MELSFCNSIYVTKIYLAIVCYKQDGSSSAIKDHSFSTFANFPKKLTFLPFDKHTCVCVSGRKKG